MDGAVIELTFFVVATFVAALVAGLSGFAFGLVAAAVWLYVLSPVQTASLIIAFGLIVQGIAVWKLRRAVEWNKLWPFLAGGALGHRVLHRRSISKMEKQPLHREPRRPPSATR